MKILVTGVCGFVGSTLTQALLDADSSLSIVGLDNFTMATCGWRATSVLSRRSTG